MPITWGKHPQPLGTRDRPRSHRGCPISIRITRRPGPSSRTHRDGQVLREDGRNRRLASEAFDRAFKLNPDLRSRTTSILISKSSPASPREAMERLLEQVKPGPTIRSSSPVWSPPAASAASSMPAEADRRARRLIPRSDQRPLHAPLACRLRRGDRARRGRAQEHHRLLADGARPDARSPSDARENQRRGAGRGLRAGARADDRSPARQRSRGRDCVAAAIRRGGFSRPRGDLHFRALCGFRPDSTVLVAATKASCAIHGSTDCAPIPASCTS